jgi:hypothetical protein
VRTAKHFGPDCEHIRQEKFYLDELVARVLEAPLAFPDPIARAWCRSMTSIGVGALLEHASGVPDPIARAWCRGDGPADLHNKNRPRPARKVVTDPDADHRYCPRALRPASRNHDDVRFWHIADITDRRRERLLLGVKRTLFHAA